MPMWRCPHCSTPQAETARCWVCHRSTTACATCRHFRRSVAAQLGYCGLDRQRRPLRGDEIRSCWESAGLLAPAGDETGAAGGLMAGPGAAGAGPGVPAAARPISTSGPRTVGPIAVGGSAAPVLHDEPGTPVRKLEFVEVRTSDAPARSPKAASRPRRPEGPAPGTDGGPPARPKPGDDAGGASPIPADPATAPRWSLWGDPEL